MDPPPQRESCLLRRQQFPLLISYEGIFLINYPHLPMTKSSPPQHKQRYYYIFWSIATLIVLTGQIFIITSNNRLSDNLEYIIIEQTRN